jgi:hypothetical protein
LRYCEYKVGSFGSSANADTSSDDDSSEEESEIDDTTTDDDGSNNITNSTTTAATTVATSVNKSIMSARSGTLHDSKFEQALAIVKQQQVSQQLKPLHYVSWRGQFIPLYSQPIADAVVSAKDAIGDLMRAVRQQQQSGTTSSSSSSSKAAAVKLQKELYTKLFKAWDTVIHLLQEQLVSLQSKVIIMLLIAPICNMLNVNDYVYADVLRMQRHASRRPRWGFTRYCTHLLLAEHLVCCLPLLMVTQGGGNRVNTQIAHTIQLINYAKHTKLTYAVQRTEAIISLLLHTDFTFSTTTSTSSLAANKAKNSKVSAINTIVFAIDLWHIVRLTATRSLIAV